MFRTLQTVLLAPAVVAALLWAAGPALARGPGGGGHGGGGFHGGGFHGGGFHGGGFHAGGFHGGGFRGDHFGRFDHGFGRGFGFGGLGYGGYPYSSYGYGTYPYYYDSYGASPYYSGDYSAPNYSYPEVQPYVATPPYSDSYYGSPTTPSVPQTMNPVSSTTTDTTAHIDVTVPDSAEVWVEGAKTKQTGSLRHFVSPPLTPGKDFVYDIRARWTDENGHVVDQTRHVPVHAGSQTVENFTESTASK
jgi:uncharacterized protein (TIGR03000 family)